MYEQFGLGRKRSPLDIRDYKLAAYIPPTLGDLSGEMRWPFNSGPLDQGDKPWCVGFAVATWGICAPVEDLFTNADGKDFYDQCKIVDGDNEEGSTIRSGATVLLQRGLIDAYAFAHTVDEITWWLLNKGPVIVGTVWTEGMFMPDWKNIIYPKGEMLGGHCYLLNQKTKDGYYHIQNSWDCNWGINGGALISIADFEILFRYDGEAMAAVELPIPITQKEGCLTQFLKMIAGK
jgi:hypothetical protein